MIGGGVSGCSTLYHLAKMGVTNAVMLEKDALTAGTTWHTAGKFYWLHCTCISIAINQLVVSELVHTCYIPSVTITFSIFSDVLSSLFKYLTYNFLIFLSSILFHKPY